MLLRGNLGGLLWLIGAEHGDFLVKMRNDLIQVRVMSGYDDGVFIVNQNDGVGGQTTE